MARFRGPLDVWVYGRHVATVRQRKFARYEMSFTESALSEFGPGSPILSLGLPVAPRGHRDTDSNRMPVHTFLDLLLPEGPLRQAVATRRGVSTTDHLALLAELGQECAGAVQVLPEGAVPAAGHLLPLSKDDVAQLVENISTHQLPPGMRFGGSLGGVQDKLLLTARADGSWAWPQDGAASTHIIKPQPRDSVHLGLIAAEHWVSRVAAHAEIPAARSELVTFGATPCLVVTRYDRDDAHRRLHQEDLCSALGIGTTGKYERAGQLPRMRTFLERARPHAPDFDSLRTELLRQSVLRIVVGDADSHYRNFSILISPEAQITVAPVYDCAPVAHIYPGQRDCGFQVSGKTRIASITLADLAAEGSAWGVPQAETVVADTAAQVLTAMNTVTAAPEIESLTAQVHATACARFT